MNTKKHKGEYFIQGLWRQLNESQKKKLLQQVGRSRKTLYRWMKKPEEIPYLHLCEITKFFNQELTPSRDYTIETLITPLEQIHFSERESS